MRKEEKKVTAVIDIRTGAVRRVSKKAMWRSSFPGTVEYRKVGRSGQMQTLFVDPVDETRLQRQIFDFAYQQGPRWIRGWFGLNGYTGKASVHFTKSMEVTSFRDIRFLNGLKKAATNMVYAAVLTMGLLCQERYEKEQKKPVQPKRKQKGGKVKQLTSENLVDFLPAEVEEKQPGKKHRRAAGHRKHVVTYNTRQWARRGTWVTTAKGTTYWREGCICHRHLLED